MKRKILSVILIVTIAIMGLSLFVGCGNNYYVFNEDDFRLTVEVNKNQAKVGDTIIVTATLENLSGRDLRVQAATPSMRNLENILLVRIAPEHITRDLVFTNEAGPVRRNTFSNGAKIERQTEVIITEEINHFVVADVFFSIGRANRVERFCSEENRTWVHFVSEEIIITIQGENHNEN